MTYSKILKSRVYSYILIFAIYVLAAFAGFTVLKLLSPAPLLLRLAAADVAATIVVCMKILLSL